MKSTTIGLVLALAAVGACKSKAKDEPAGGSAKPAPPAIDAAAPPPAIDASAVHAAVACPPDQDALRAAAQKIFALKGEIGETQCTALVAGGSAHWLIELGYSTDDGDHFYAGLIDASTGQATWNFTYEAPEGVSLDKQEVVDLDGDGDEELVSTRWGGSHGMASGTLEVLAVAAGKIVEKAELKLGYTNEGAVAIGLEKKLSRCEGAHQIIDSPDGHHLIEVIGAKHVGALAETDCPKLGRHVYRYDGKALTEVTP
jgi:hypothetical protein